jgi:hypothetical protein
MASLGLILGGAALIALGVTWWWFTAPVTVPLGIVFIVVGSVAAVSSRRGRDDV